MFNVIHISALRRLLVASAVAFGAWSGTLAAQDAQNSLADPIQSPTYPIAMLRESSIGWGIWLFLTVCLIAFIHHRINVPLRAIDQSKLPAASNQRRWLSRPEPVFEPNGLPSESLAFSMIAAHDLRAPLRQQTGLLQILKNDLLSCDSDLSSDVKTTLTQLETAAKRMDELISDLLDFSAQKTPESQTSERISLLETIQSVRDLNTRLDQHSLQIEGTLPDVLAPKTALETVLRNLIFNAMAHHDKRCGRIVVSTRCAGRVVEVMIADDGPGIDMAARETIFAPLQRGRTSASGSGLGLAVASSMVQSWGGEISVTANTPRGSIFCFTVPLFDAARRANYPMTETLAAQARARGLTVSQENPPVLNANQRRPRGPKIRLARGR